MISTHAPLARCDGNAGAGQSAAEFQLTHLLRGATGLVRDVDYKIYNFNSRTSCEVRPGRPSEDLRDNANFNSRTSCEVRHVVYTGTNARTDFNSRTSCEVRQAVQNCLLLTDEFQLTHLLRGATRRG